MKKKAAKPNPCMVARIMSERPARVILSSKTLLRCGWIPNALAVRIVDIVSSAMVPALATSSVESLGAKKMVNVGQSDRRYHALSITGHKFAHQPSCKHDTRENGWHGERKAPGLSVGNYYASDKGTDKLQRHRDFFRNSLLNEIFKRMKHFSFSQIKTTSMGYARVSDWIRVATSPAPTSSKYSTSWRRIACRYRSRMRFELTSEV